MGFQVLVKCWKFLVKHWKFYPNLTKKETKFSKNVQTQICSNETLLEVLTRVTRRHQVGGGGADIKMIFFFKMIWDIPKVKISKQLFEPWYYKAQ